MKVVEFIKNNENWRDLLVEPPFCLSIKEDEDFALLKYSQIDSDFSEDIVKECRGLIIDLHTLEPVALSFYKFFNVQEQYADTIYWNECRVQEKVDGSKVLVWYNTYKKKWQVSTSGELDAYTANVSDFGITFGNLFDKAIQTLGIENFYDLLDMNFCYTFELVSPESRVVVPYKKTKIYFIGVRYVPTFIECNPDSFESLCAVVPRPKEYKLNSLKACLIATDKMGFDEEGFVVVDKHWKRVKIKSPAYVAAHHLRNNGINSRARVLEIIEKNEQSEFLGLFPEYSDVFEEVEKSYNNLKQRIVDAVENVNYLKVQWANNDNPRKALAEYINSNYKDISGILFKFIGTNLVEYFITHEWRVLSKDKKAELLGFKDNNDEKTV